MLVMIQERMKRLPPLIDIVDHIKEGGHEDKHKTHEELSLLAQLHVDADRMASSFQRTFGLVLAQKPCCPQPLAQH